MIFLLACAERAAESAPEKQSAEDAARLQTLGYDDGAGGPGARGGGGGYGAAPAASPASDEAAARVAQGGAPGKGLADALAGPSADAAPARAWFPESFLWRPLVEVPESGTVTVPIPVPDTLTTWRLLALGQTRAGAQAGAVTAFASSLPAYVDLAPPSFLWAGDTVELPVQAVNQQADPLDAALVVEEGGVAVGGGEVRLPAYGSVRRTVSLRADRAGSLALRARLGAVDVVEKTVPVRPVGRPVDQARGGTLAAPRSFTLSGAGSARAAELVVTVFPGALGVARAELAAAPLRGASLADAAYTYAVAGLAAPLVAEGAVRPDELRATRLRAWQVLARATRVPDASTAGTALLAVRGAPADSLEGRLAARLAEQLTASQGVDGLWIVESGAALDAALVETARLVWALGPDNRANRLRATGAFERHRARLDAPHVAAWALAADVVDSTTAEALRDTLRAALRVGADGAKTLRVDARRADGTPVPEAETTALAVLALPADDPARADLAAGLLGLYDPVRGFGDGTTGLLALRALGQVFVGEVPKQVAVRVTVDGVEVGVATLDPAQPHAPVRILAPGLVGPGERRVTVAATPPVPGLAFTAVARAWVPWVQAAPGGVDLRVERPALAVGVPADLVVSVAGPADTAFDVSVGLPAGVEPDTAALDALVGAGRAGSWRAEDGRITLANIVTEGGAWSAGLRVTPTLAGTLLADASRVTPAGGTVAAFERVPERWDIR